MPESGDRLLDMKQAAALLKVSEVSLRRWTNSGRLPCIRIGGRRERRFRREELLAFAHGTATEAAESRRSTPPAQPQVTVNGVAVSLRSHLCALYRDDRARLAIGLPFLREGLEAGDTCLLIAAPPVCEAFLTALRGTGCDVDALLRSRRLILAEGGPDPDLWCNAFEDLLMDATSRGAAAIRALGDMAWTRRQGMSEAELLRFERDCELTVVRRYPVAALCLYDARAFTGTALLDALQTHRDIHDHPLHLFLH